MKDLSVLRLLIDAVDQKIITLISQRLELVNEVGEYKKAHNLPIFVPEREAEILANLGSKAKKLGVSESLIQNLYAVMFEFSKQVQTTHKGKK